MDVISFVLLQTLFLLIVLCITNRRGVPSGVQRCQPLKRCRKDVHHKARHVRTNDRPTHVRPSRAGGKPRVATRSSTTSTPSVSTTMNKIISEIDNANGIIYRQHQREFKHMSDINRRQKKRNRSKIVGKFIGRQQYVETHIDEIRRDILVKYMRKIRPYMKTPIRHASLVRDNCEDALVLAKELNAEDDIQVIQAVLARVGQPSH